MALSIKTQEADRLARELSRLTGRTMTAVVTEALAEKLARERERNPPKPIDRDELERVLAKLRRGMDLRPATKAEYDEVCDAGIDAYLTDVARAGRR